MERCSDLPAVSISFLMRSSLPTIAGRRLPSAFRKPLCLVSTLAFHGLTDQLPRHVWLAIGRKNWAPKTDGSPIRIVRFNESLLNEGCQLFSLW